MQLPADQLLYSNTLGVEVPAEMAQRLLHPVGIWRFEWPQYVVWAVLAAWMLSQSRRRGRLTFGALLFLSMTTAFWQEFYADWGAYLVYSPRFSLIPWDSPLTSPNKPWYTWAAYGNYFLPIFALMVWVIGKLRRRMPRLPLLVAALMVSVPMFYLFNLGVEGTAVANGWWTYLRSPGPYLDMTGGLKYPLVFPVLPFAAWGAVNATLLSMRDANGDVRFESLAFLRSMPEGAGKQLARLLVWCVAMNASYWFAFIGPLLLMRLTGIV